MKNIVETVAEALNELVGTFMVFACLAGALVLFRAFGDHFISYFI